MQVRTAQHEVCTGLTDLRAVEQQAYVVSFRMRAPLLQTVLGSLCTDGMTLLAILSEFLHVLMIHGVPPGLV